VLCLLLCGELREHLLEIYAMPSKTFMFQDFARWFKSQLAEESGGDVSRVGLNL
jgi:hypothetical protein